LRNYLEDSKIFEQWANWVSAVFVFCGIFANENWIFLLSASL
jgi:hypothetical protein